MAFENDNKAPKGGDAHKQESAHEETHSDALDAFRLARPEPAKEAPAAKVEAPKTADASRDLTEAIKAKYDKNYDEKSGESYSDFLARTHTPEQNEAAIMARLSSVSARINALEQNGFPAKADVTQGGSFLAGVVRDGSVSDFQKLMEKLNSQIKEA
ncbi:MAG: hypothetical protein K2X81_26750 [Candidatus Obscuribacterales bacterium]|nr:hypothetical protein [Candidatus Obscuribacterales bacterium]